MDESGHYALSYFTPLSLRVSSKGIEPLFNHSAQPCLALTSTQVHAVVLSLVPVVPVILRTPTAPSTLVLLVVSPGSKVVLVTNLHGFILQCRTALVRTALQAFACLTVFVSPGLFLCLALN